MNDQERTVLKAIEHVGRGGPATIAQVIKAVSYPRAATKRALVRLADAGIIWLHRHDYPGSLSSADRKFMIRIRGEYFGAVSMRKKNTGTKGKGKRALKKAGRAVKGAARGLLAAGSQILGAGAKALNPRGIHLPGLPRKAQREYEHILAGARAEGRYGKRAKEVAARTVEKQYGGKMAKGRRNPKPDPKTGLHIEYLPANNAWALMWHSQILHIGTKRDMQYEKRLLERGASSNPRKGTRRAKGKSSKLARRRTPPRGEDYSDWSLPLLKSYRKQVAGHLKWLGANEPRASAVVKQRLADVDTELKRRKSKPRRRNLGHKDSDHPVEVTHHYRAGPPGYMTPWQRAHHAGQKQLFETGIKPAKKRNPTRRGMRKGYGQARALGRTDPKRKPMLRRAARGGKQITRKGRRNPSAVEIRKDFAGRAGAGRDLYFPNGTPSGQLAKLGKLVLIKTQAGDVAPVAGAAWLCSDTKGRLHIGATKPAPLFDGPARNLGPVRMIEYEETKPHLGYPNPTIWFHRMGEETGRKPTLHVDKHGGLHIKGGAYRVTRRGVEN